MRLEPAGLKSAKFVRSVSGVSARSLGAPEEADRSLNEDTVPVPSDRHADLAQQCRSRIEELSPRQRDVLAGLIAGHSNKEIARTLGISPRTIEVYRAGLMDRLKARTLAQVLHIAFVAGLALDTMSLGTG